MQANQLGTGLPQTIVAMITSNMSRAGHASRVIVSTGSAAAKNSGLLTDSVVVADNLATVLDPEIDQVIGNLTIMDEVNEALRVTLGL